jgi:predicted enzyme related to lactoylglutathione lyase
MATHKNPFAWIEIYVADMDRAKQFYETVLGTTLSALPMPEGSGDMQMLSFPSEMGPETLTTGGALVKMTGVNPGGGGTLAYFTCEDCAVEEGRVEAAGGKVTQPKMSIGEYGFISLLVDTEGNMVGLHSMK